MPKARTIIYILSILLIACKPQPVTLKGLLNEITDRDALAKFPDPQYTLKHFSSYDRATTKPGNPSWFANWDRSMFLREETNGNRTEYVMFDDSGAGAIVRFWMTFAGENAGKGILRIYFDNKPKPLIEGPALDVLSGNLIVGEPLASSVSDSTKYEMRGHNLYFPLPYASQCKVTYESKNILDAGAKTGGEAVYYNIDYRSYNQGIKVVSFSTDELNKASNVIAETQQQLKQRFRGIDKLSTNIHPLSGTITAGSTLIKFISGEEAIRMVRLKLKPEINPQALRTTLVEFVFDDNQTVWCPLGDFFGTGYQLRHSNTWYSSVDTDGTLSAYWVMPFNNSAKMAIHNTGSEDIEIIDGEILTSPWKWNDNSMYFGTYWNQFTHLKTGEMKDNQGNGTPFDLNFVELSGKGVYVGDALTVFNTMYAWWGEGDEKIYVDGENFPSHIGTGTEDYYGYAWCRPEKFSNHPFIAQPDGSGNFWPGYTVNLRFRALDAIPFTSSLKFDMEMWHWTRAIINYAPTTFWYIRPDGKCLSKLDTAGIHAPVALKRSDIISPIIENNKIEGENMIPANTTGGNINFQNASNFGWSQNMQFFWHDAKKGDKTDLIFQSANSFDAIIKANLTMAPDYGVFNIYLNGKKVIGACNLYNDSVSTRKISLGKQTIMKGENHLQIEISGIKNNEGKAFFGIDYLDFSNN